MPHRIHSDNTSDITTIKLQQLRYALETYWHNLNTFEAADALFTSQPGISKQIRLLEEKLGIQILVRSGKRMASVSQPGKAVLEISERILRDVQNIKNIGSEFTDHDSGSLIIATTHAQARYALPKIVAEFVKNYPKVNLTTKRGNPSATAQMASGGETDLAIIAERTNDHPESGKLLCHEWNHVVIVPHDHPLSDCRSPLSLKDLASFSPVTYEFAFNSGSSIARTLNKAHIEQPDVALSVADMDVLKTYVCLGLGVGLMVKMAYDPVVDQDLQLIDAAHLFEPSPTRIALRTDTYLRGYVYDFIQVSAPRPTREVVDCTLCMPVVEDLLV